MPKKVKFKNKPKDELDAEVDHMLKLAKSKRFEPGIYNFCDRWCERCADTEKCFLFAEDVQRNARKIMQGKDTEDENEWLKDVEHNFAVTARLMERKLAEEGIDMNKAIEEAKDIKHWDENAHEMFKDSTCHKLAENYMKKAFDFLKKFHEARMEFYGQLGMEIDYSDIKDEIETISWYSSLLPTKIWRYFYEQEALKHEEDEELKELMAADSPKFYSLVMKCISQSLNAWQNLGVKRPDLAKECGLFIKSLEKIKAEYIKLAN